MTDPLTDKLQPLRIRLTVVFLTALLIGPGLGAHLSGGDPENVRFLFGMPALYLWLVFTCLVMTSCILIAARNLWRDED